MAERLPWSIQLNPDLDRWIAIRGDQSIVIRTGKAELGQGIRTALAAIAADELMVDPSRIVVEGAATDTSPNEGVTAGSGSIEQSGAGVRQACAHAREILARVDIAEFADGRRFDHQMTEVAPELGAGGRSWVGRGLARLDLPAKVRGEAAFVHDLRPHLVRHARVVRPPVIGARLRSTAPVDAPDGCDVVQRGSFVAVVADRLGDAVRGADEVAAQLAWQGGGVDVGADDPDWMTAHVTRSVAIVEGTAVDDEPAPALDHAGAATVMRARYVKPFILHGSMGPSAAVARFDRDTGRLKVWSHSQGVELLKGTISEVVGLEPEAVSVIHVDGAGCYGHNGADDAAADAALVAMARPDEVISLGWSRADEHRFEPASPAMVVDLAAGLDERGCILTWDHDVYSYPHGARPRPMGDGRSGLLSTWYFEPPLEAPRSPGPRGFHSGGHRNADPLYDIATRRVVHHFLRESPIRTSSTRGLGAYANVFAIESFMDELALASGQDPIAFRLAHLRDERARAVVEAVADMAGGLEAEGGDDAPGRGIAFAQYENIKTYCAVIAEVGVVAHTGEIRLLRTWIAADAGQIIDPDGLANQLEGGFVQAASWTLKEKVEIGLDGPVATDWDGYPILRFSECPTVEVRLLDRPDERSLGAGEASTGPAGAAIANAVAEATGARLRDLPLTPDKVKAALAALL